VSQSGHDESPVGRLRSLCLALPEATQKEIPKATLWLVRNKVFAMARHDGGRPALWCKAAPGGQELLVAADPARFFAPPSVCHKGWIGLWLDDGIEWAEVDVVVKRSYRLSVPKRLALLLDGTP